MSSYGSVAATRYVAQQLQMRQIAAATPGEGLALLPKEVRKEIRREARAIATRDVFGVDHKTARDGTPIEQGIGSPGNMTQNAVEAYVTNQTDKKRRGDAPPEEGYKEKLDLMRKQLAETQARRRATEDSEDD